jgi:hypothetical protein
VALAVAVAAATAPVAAAGAASALMAAAAVAPVPVAALASVPAALAPVPVALATAPVPDPAALRFGDATTIGGALVDAAGSPRAGVLVQLQQDPFPYSGFADLALATTGVDGSYAFTSVRPDRNTRYRVIEPGSAPLSLPRRPSASRSRRAPSCAAASCGRDA